MQRMNRIPISSFLVISHKFLGFFQEFVKSFEVLERLYGFKQGRDQLV